MTRRFFSFAVFIVSLLAFVTSGGMAWALTQKAQEIYERFSPSVYQIQIIDINSGEKSAIGSGFRFSDKGSFATNYHVVSDFVEKPDRYRIEFRKDNGEKGDLTLQALDVAHDLAILQGEKSEKPSLKLGRSNLSKGRRVFPMGNPFDLGMTIVEGTYNGLLGDESYQHILLSAPLNSGMSGGPALDASGQVVGINVSVGGNDLSYLVPVEYLKNLAKGLEGKEQSEEWREIIQRQLLKKFDHVMTNLLKTEWAYEKFGSLRIPKDISPNIKCWGQSKSEDLEENQFVAFGNKSCQSENNVYLTSRLRTGSIGYSFDWMESGILGSRAFYKNYSKEFAASDFYPAATEKEVTEFSCKSEFVKLADKDWKAAYCVRNYKKFPRLHDAFITFAILGQARAGHLIRIGLAGISEDLANRFLMKFLEGIQWVE